MNAIELNRTQKVRAVRAIEGVHSVYHDADGIAQLEKRLDDQKAAAAKHVYGLAVHAMESTPTRLKAIDLFLALSLHAETEYKTAHNVASLSETLPTWKTFKSNILTGMRDYELDPREFRTEGAFRVAKQKLQATENDGGTPTRVPKPLETPDAIDHVLATTVTHDALRTMVSQVVFMLESLKRGTVKDAQAVLRVAMDGLAPLVDERKVA